MCASVCAKLSSLKGYNVCELIAVYTHKHARIHAHKPTPTHKQNTVVIQKNHLSPRLTPGSHKVQGGG